MKKGDVIKGPAIIRRKYKGEWEYALLFPGGTFSPFGKVAPSAVKWCYQVTWKDILQRVHVLKGDDNRWPNDRMTGRECDCWWRNKEPWGGRLPEYITALEVHSGEAPAL